ncbi:MAG: rod shape-determining protein MreC [Actinomycetota bacterium]|nr:rod shape-determining protein MreC [Actinomycetota bacterium]
MRGPHLRLLLALLVLTAFTLIAVDARAGGSPLDALRRGADTVLGPAQRALGGGTRTVTDALAALPRLDDYRDDNARLARENAALRARLRETEALRRRAAELDRLLALRPAAAHPVVPARVVAVGDSLGFAWTATIDAGSRDGVREDQTVLSGDGLVGRTTRVGPTTSTVLLLVDPGFTVGARLQRSGALGLASGTGGGLRLELVDTDAEVRVGDVVTSTRSATFVVPDLPLGRVTRVLRPGALTRTVEVQPLVDVGRLDLVGVVVAPARTGERAPLPGR